MGFWDDLWAKIAVKSAVKRAVERESDKKMAKKKGCISATLLKFGSTSWIRTKDPMINSHLLYQLS